VTRVARVRTYMAKMSSDERERYLADLHVGVIAVERPDRAPLALPIWYGYEPGGEVTIWTTEGTQKHEVIQAAGRFSINAQDEQPPYKYVTAEGDVTEIAAAVEADARKIAIRYLGKEAGDQFTDENFTPNSIVIRMRPQKWLSSDYSKDS
jgi:nitroimidazol reductase NimA-like FMN-containing flavoprotein (pyridoxamine 5'-phosphate oxidase superfamily)